MKAIAWWAVRIAYLCPLVVAAGSVYIWDRIRFGLYKATMSHDFVVPASGSESSGAHWGEDLREWPECPVPVVATPPLKLNFRPIAVIKSPMQPSFSAQSASGEPGLISN